jgi:hypothetical protein
MKFSAGSQQWQRALTAAFPVGDSTSTSTRSTDGQGRHRYLTAALFFCPRLTESLPFAAFRPGFFRHSGGSPSPSIGGFPCPARARIRRVSARSALRPLSRKYSSVRKAETFSATATLMSWFRATPSISAALRNSSSKEGCSRNAKLLRLKGAHS